MNYFMIEEKNTEQKILEAAKSVFLEKGKDGTTMQAIADKAGINKALLHYYFRSKDKLFRKVLEETMSAFLPKIEETFTSEIDFFDKIRMVVKNYISLLYENPFIPAFMLNEINRNPDELFSIIKESGIHPDVIFAVIEKEIEKGNIISIAPRQFFSNLLSLCIFPIAARPLLKRALLFATTEEYNNFIEERKTQVSEFIINAIKVK